MMRALGSEVRGAQRQERITTNAERREKRAIKRERATEQSGAAYRTESPRSLIRAEERGPREIAQAIPLVRGRRKH